MGYLNYELISDYSGENFKIIKSNNNVTIHFSNYSFDDSNYVEYACRDYNFHNLSTCLVAGLGLGIIPTWITTNYPNCEVDVVEIDGELVEVIYNMNYLNSKINIINENIFNYIPTKTYDLIIFDIWGTYEPNIENDVSTLYNKFSPFVNSNDRLSFPFV